MRRHVVGSEIELAKQQLEHLLADAGLHLDTHGAAEPPAAQFHLDCRQQVVGLFVFLCQVDVAGDPEHRVLLDDHSDEQLVQVGGNQLLDR